MGVQTWNGIGKQSSVNGQGKLRDSEKEGKREIGRRSSRGRERERQSRDGGLKKKNVYIPNYLFVQISNSFYFIYFN